VTRKRKKIYVGLSGGVDSSVSAALLKKAGYDVTGVFIKVWQPDFYECTWREDRLDAMRVCAKLEIPFVTLDLEDKYKREVVDYMVREYKAGRTPNPDVMCNRHVKFGAFFDWAIKQGADMVATGHYAQVKKSNGKYTLLAAADSSKDQTYFLWTLTDKQLPRVLFPIGHLLKKDVRKLATAFDLPTAKKKDSQGLCFVGKVDMKEFLGHFVKSKRGNVLDVSGHIIGHHQGALFFTVGERHGFTLKNNSPDGGPQYVMKKDIKRNTITVSPSKVDPTNDSLVVDIKDVNLIEPVPSVGKKYQARIRYRQPLETCTILKKGTGTYQILFERPQIAVTAGQSLVLYDNGICRGGGIIVG
jgi:tRNA-specific 2-thiouridylase